MGQLVDFTAYKLQEIANSLDNPEDTEVVLSILGDYFEGLIAIAWEHGAPVVMPMSDGAQFLHGIPAGFSVVGYKAEELLKGDEG